VASRDRQVGTALTSLASTIWARSQAPGASGFLGSLAKVGGAERNRPPDETKFCQRSRAPWTRQSGLSWALAATRSNLRAVGGKPQIYQGQIEPEWQDNKLATDRSLGLHRFPVVDGCLALRTKHNDRI